MFMDRNSEVEQRFTGLILLSGVDSPGITSALFSTLEPFSITVIDIEQVIIRSRLILTVLIDLNPAHASAIEEDLNVCAKTLNVDIAVSFESVPSETIEERSCSLCFTAAAQKMSPGFLASITKYVLKNGGNIEKIQRQASSPLTSIEFQISGFENQSFISEFESFAKEFDVQITFREK